MRNTLDLYELMLSISRSSKKAFAELAREIADDLDAGKETFPDAADMLRLLAFLHETNEITIRALQDVGDLYREHDLKMIDNTPWPWRNRMIEISKRYSDLALTRLRDAADDYHDLLLHE